MVNNSLIKITTKVQNPIAWPTTKYIKIQVLKFGVWDQEKIIMLGIIRPQVRCPPS